MWTVGDLLDQEYFCRQDEQLIQEGREEELHQRDRQVYTGLPRPPSTRGTAEVALLRAWLAARRQEFVARHGQGRLPGTIWRELALLAGWFALLLGALSGGGLAWGILHYAGKTPVNVAVFFSLLVLVQVALLLILLMLALYRQMVHLDLSSSPLYFLVTRLLARILDRIGRRVGGTTRLQLSGWMGRMGIRGSRVGPVLLWSAFLLVQLYGIGFNMGGVGTTLMKVTGSDLAFGWQTTLQISPELVARLVRLVAWPWAWLLGAGIGYPTPAQIQGSHLVLKQGIYHLATSALVSWWPFLCLSMVFYGLLPRMGLFIGGWWHRQRLLAKALEQSRCSRQVLLRMQTPLLKTRSPGVSDRSVPVTLDPSETTPVDNDAPAAGPEVITRSRQSENGTRALLLVPKEIRDLVPTDQLRHHRTIRALYRVTAVLAYDLFALEDGRLLAEIQERLGPSGRVFIVQEAWQPPIQELLVFLGELVRGLPRQVDVQIVLVGRPAPEGCLLPPTDLEVSVWRQKIASLALDRLSCQVFAEL